LSQDRELIKKHWNRAYHPGYFGDLGDGVHKGDENDPRVSIIEVVPCEIRYWVASSSSIVRSAQVVYSTVTGKGTAPGELRIITEEEVS
jgi:general stress protein 26